MEPWKVQGSPEWLEFRSSHITATDAAAIAGLNPYKDAHDVYREKIGEHKPYVNKAMKRGSSLEEPARQAYEALTGLPIYDDVIVHKKRP